MNHIKLHELFRSLSPRDLNNFDRAYLTPPQLVLLQLHIAMKMHPHLAHKTQKLIDENLKVVMG